MEPPGAADGTYTGDPASNRFGTTRVFVRIPGGRIADVQAAQLNDDDPHSYQLSVAAAGVLRSEVMTAQTGAVDTVSGATCTSEQYRSSLQSALERAGYRPPGG